MARESQPASLFTQVDITAGTHVPRPVSPQFAQEEQLSLLRNILAAQDRSNELLEEIVTNMGAMHRQRATELAQWKDANPVLAESCRYASEALTRVQVAYLDQITREINDNEESMADGEYAFNEFVDRFGPRLAQLNGVIQVLATLGSTSNPAIAE
jgi:hypothetical protein